MNSILRSRKADGGLTLIVIIIIALLFIGWLVNVGQRECNRDKDCAGQDSYCGSDFSCHQHPTIQRTIVQYNLFWPAVIIALGIVAAAWIFRNGGSITAKEEPKVIEETAYVEKESKEVEEITEPYYKSSNGYYKSDGNVKVP